MSQSPTPSALQPGPWVLALMILAATLTLLLPHPPNFSPVEAIALFGGAYYASRWLALAVPLLAMFLSDLALGLMHGGIYFDYFASVHFLGIYACIALTTLLAFTLRGRVTGARVLGYSLLGSVLFFLITNALSATEFCRAGLLSCYAAGLPFFQWTVLGTLFYAAILFGGFALLRQRLPQLQAQTV
jgi:hypothetical protein